MKWDNGFKKRALTEEGICAKQTSNTGTCGKPVRAAWTWDDRTLLLCKECDANAIIYREREAENMKKVTEDVLNLPKDFLYYQPPEVISPELLNIAFKHDLLIGSKAAADRLVRYLCNVYTEHLDKAEFARKQRTAGDSTSLPPTRSR